MAWQLQSRRPVLRLKPATFGACQRRGRSSLSGSWNSRCPIICLASASYTLSCLDFVCAALPALTYAADTYSFFTFKARHVSSAYYLHISKDSHGW